MLDDINTWAERRLVDKSKLFKRFTDNFISNYNVSEYAVVDEMLDAMRWNCSFAVYIPSKPAKYSTKILVFGRCKKQ